MRARVDATNSAMFAERETAGTHERNQPLVAAAGCDELRAARGVAAPVFVAKVIATATGPPH